MHTSASIHRAFIRARITPGQAALAVGKIMGGTALVLAGFYGVVWFFALLGAATGIQG